MSEVINSFDPQLNTYLLGHKEAEDLFLRCWKNNSLHNSWLISGIKGIGKATLAFKIARFILGTNCDKKENYDNLDISPNSQVYKLIAGNAHPDFKLLQRDYTDTDRKKIVKAIKDGDALSNDELKELKKSAYIRVDDVRTINEFLARKSSGDGWRVVIIDSVDDMNSAAANAVLKILEEPPYKTLMLLISHNPNRLLPTIRSRCAKLELKPLKNEEISSLIRRYRSELSEKEIKKVTNISAGSIGKALVYADNGAADIYDNLCSLATTGINFKIAEVLDFCNKATISEETYELTKELVLKFLSDHAKNTDKVIETAECWNLATKTFSEVDNLNMDKKQALMNIIVNMCKQI